MKTFYSTFTLDMQASPNQFYLYSKELSFAFNILQFYY